MSSCPGSQVGEAAPGSSAAWQRGGDGKPESKGGGSPPRGAKGREGQEGGRVDSPVVAGTPCSVRVHLLELHPDVAVTLRTAKNVTCAIAADVQSFMSTDHSGTKWRETLRRCSSCVGRAAFTCLTCAVYDRWQETVCEFYCSINTTSYIILFPLTAWR